MAQNDDMVVFHDSDGNEISNDPRWHHRKFAEQEKERLQNLESTPGDSDDEIEKDELDELNGRQLKKLAEEEDVDISGLTKVGQVREAIRSARAQQRTDPPED